MYYSNTKVVEFLAKRVESEKYMELHKEVHDIHESIYIHRNI